MPVIAAMFDSRGHAEEAIDRLVAAHCPRDAITFLPEEDLSEVDAKQAYDWRADHWGLWRKLAAFEMMSHPDRYALAEGMNRGASVLLVAAPDEEDIERFCSVLVEAGAVDLDEREKTWRDAGWTGFDGSPKASIMGTRRPKPSRRVRLY